MGAPFGVSPLSPYDPYPPPSDRSYAARLDMFIFEFTTATKERKINKWLTRLKKVQKVQKVQKEKL